MLQKGDKAPLELALTNEGGNSLTLKDFLGTWVVVYFYPRDNTPGCTVEAEGFRDHKKKFDQLGAKILGVSKDTCASHQKFIEKKELTFTLIADEEHELMEAFGVWGEKQFMGRTFMGTIRSTFLVDPNGKVAYVWEKVKPAGHPQEVFEVLQTLH